MTETNLSVEERRERRRQKILRNGKERLNVLLSGGPDGMARQAPALDGFADSEFLRDNSDNDKNNISNEYIDLFKSVLNTAEVSPLANTGISSYLDVISQNHFFIALFLGFFFGLAVNFELVDRIILPFATLFFGYELAAMLIQKCQKQPRQTSLTMNFLMMNGINENFLFYTTLLVDCIWKFFVDLIIIAFVYICTTLIFILFGPNKF